MKIAFLAACCAGLASAIEPLIVGFGASFASGLGLDKPLGEVLRRRLDNSTRVKHRFLNLAEPGAKLFHVTKSQAPKVMGDKPALMYMIAGGPDVEYISCMNDPMLEYCYLPIHRDEFAYRYMGALDALVQVAQHDRTVPIYLITYPEAIGTDTDCKQMNHHCRFSKKQFKMVTSLYQTLLNYTLSAIDEWKAVGSNDQYRVKVVPMHLFSKDHHITAMYPWIQSPKYRNSRKGDGAMWHPTRACVASMADDICKDLSSGHFLP